MNSLQQTRVNTKARLQYEAAECGAASLGIILQYFGRFVELSELRIACGINRDGSNAKQLLIAGRNYGLDARAYKSDTAQLVKTGSFPCIVFWGFNHYLVLEGFDKFHAFLSDPEQGRVRVTLDEFQDKFTGVVLEFSPNENFKPGGKESSPLLTLPSKLYPYKRDIFILLFVASAQASLSLLVAGLTSTFVDTFLENQKYYFGIPVIWLLFVSVSSWLILLGIQFLLLRRLEFSLAKKITSDLFRKLFTTEFDFFQSRFQGEIASRMLLGLSTTEVIVAEFLRFLVKMWIGIIVFLFAFFISPWLSLLVLVFTIGNFYLNWALTNLRYDSNRKLTIEEGKATGKGLQGINNIESIKSSGLEFDFLSQWQGSFSSVVVQNQLLGKQMAYSTIASSGSTLLINALIIVFGGILIVFDQISLGVLVAFQFLQSQLTAPISALPQMNASFQRLIGDLGRLDDLSNTKDDPLVRTFDISKTAEQYFPQSSDTTSKLHGDIHLKELSFSFDPVSPPFIDSLELHIPAGSHLAIVGGSGSGKTTLIRLIAGLYQPTHGQILFDKLSWLEHSDFSMRSSLAYVPQQVFVFNASFLDNITLWDSNYSFKDLEDAASDAQILNTIRSHPEGFSRQLLDNGSDLSGGERQRLEICRALIRCPSILLLDEATSALDNETQSRILAMLKQRHITVISVAHRLTAALQSDMVMVLDHGKVVERGSPSDLLSKNGAFKALVDSEQSLGVSQS